MRKFVAGAWLIGAMLLSLMGCKSESGERNAGCEDKPSEVIAKEINADGHLMLTLSCGSDFNWYVTWDEPDDEADRKAYDSYEIGDTYP